MSTWDRLRQEQLDRQAVEQLNAMAPFAKPTLPDSNADELHVTLEEYAYSVAQLVARKQADYGPHAINRAPGGALNGINVRLHDKLQRAAHLSGNPHPANHESIFDTYMDVAGYALIALLYLDGQWPA